MRLRNILRAATKITFILSVVLLVAVLLAAMPRRHAPRIPAPEQEQASPEQPAESPDTQNMRHQHAATADTQDEKLSEAGAVQDMNRGQRHQPGPHMHHGDH